VVVEGGQESDLRLGSGRECFCWKNIEQLTFDEISNTVIGEEEGGGKIEELTFDLVMMMVADSNTVP